MADTPNKPGDSRPGEESQGHQPTSGGEESQGQYPGTPVTGSPANPFDTQPRVPQRQDMGRQMLGERERTYRLLALVKGDIFSKPKHRMMADEVMVWPDLVVLEMLSAVVFTILLIAVAVLINAPLEALADPTCTPNPSKAPWYFMNLQELLLHMHPALAGVIVPTLALVLIAAIPYFDKDPRGVGVYFTTAAGRAITVFSMIFATILTTGLILFDEFIGLRDAFAWASEPLDAVGTWNIPLAGELKLGAFLVEVIIPTIPMILLPLLLVWIVKQRWGGNPRYYALALFSGFFAVFVLLTIVGTAFRGVGMELFWPWAMPARIGC